MCSELGVCKAFGSGVEVSVLKEETHTLPSHLSFGIGSWILLVDSHFVMLLLHAELQKCIGEVCLDGLIKRLRGVLMRSKKNKTV